MARCFPLAGVHHLRGLDLAIAGGIDGAAHIGFQAAPDDIALGMPENRPVRFLLQVEQVHLRAQLAMVALARFLQPRQMVGQLPLVEPARAIDAGQHRILLVAAPIGARHARQLEGGRIELAGGGEVWAAAHVVPAIGLARRARMIDGQFFALRQFGGPLRLEAFARGLPLCNQRIAVDHLAAQRLVGGDDLAHLRFDRGQVFLGEGTILGRKIVVKAILGRRAEGDLRAGEQRLHRFGQHMGEIMPRQFQRVSLVPARHQRQRRVLLQRPADVAQFAIHSRGDRRLGQPRTDRRRNVRRRSAGRDFTHGTIGQSDFEHGGHDMSFC